MQFTSSSDSLISATGSSSTGSSSSSSSSSSPVGQAFYGYGSGTSSWTCPPGVTTVCVVCIGAGSSSLGAQWSVYAGGGGGLGWKNNIPVTPGSTYEVQVGFAGSGYGSSVSGSPSYFISAGTVQGNGASGSSGGAYTGDGGGNGGNGGQYGGGGAGGYTGNGGNQDASGAGGGGAGGGSYSSTHGGASGGGTGPFGQSASGSYTYASGGRGGSGGQPGVIGENPWYSYGSFGDREGGMYGGGGGGSGSNAPQGGAGLNRGGRGCVRIIWGAGRSFPSTGTGDM